MDIIFILRIIIAATFVITASGFPLAIFLLRRFIKLYTRQHKELQVEVQGLVARVTRMEQGDG